jgi:hypothetical protein
MKHECLESLDFEESVLEVDSHILNQTIEEGVHASHHFMNLNKHSCPTTSDINAAGLKIFPSSQRCELQWTYLRPAHGRHIHSPAQ